MRTFFSIFFLVITLSTFVPVLGVGDVSSGVISTAYAQDAGGLVSCSGPDCTFCSVVTTTSRVITFVITLAIIIATIVLAYAGVKLAMSQGNPGALNEAKGFLFNVIIGIFIILIAWTLVDTMLKLLLADNLADGNFGVWNEVEECGGMNAAGEAVTRIEVSDEVIRAFDVESSASTVVTQTIQVSSNSPVGGAGGSNGVQLATNGAMGPIFDPSQGGSSLVKPGAASKMQDMLSGPFARLQSGFGRPIVINDAIAKAGSSRETNTKGSRHFHGDALDLSTSGMSDADKIRLYEEAKKAGFTGFGFGRNILHVDLGPRRGWAYGNSTYGGRSVRQLINSTY